MKKLISVFLSSTCLNYGYVGFYAFSASEKALIFTEAILFLGWEESAGSMCASQIALECCSKTLHKSIVFALKEFKHHKILVFQKKILFFVSLKFNQFFYLLCYIMFSISFIFDKSICPVVSTSASTLFLLKTRTSKNR